MPSHLFQMLQPPFCLCICLGLPQLQQALYLSVLELSILFGCLFFFLLHVFHIGGPAQGARGGPALPLSPGLGQAIQKAAGEGHSLALVFFMQFPQVSILPAPELHHSLVASELL